MNDQMNKCGCPCHKMGIALFLIAIGVVFLLKNLGVIDDHVSNIIWPSLIIVAGLKKLAMGMCKCCNKAGCEKQ